MAAFSSGASGARLSSLRIRAVVWWWMAFMTAPLFEAGALVSLGRQRLGSDADDRDIIICKCVLSKAGTENCPAKLMGIPQYHPHSAKVLAALRMRTGWNCRSWSSQGLCPEGARDL
jgi:hypothetical protein